jgi:hypothetical protein
MERIDDMLFWNDLHWRFDKVESSARKEWNKGLENTDDMGLTADERQLPFSHIRPTCAHRSANPSCNKWETQRNSTYHAADVNSLLIVLAIARRKAPEGAA